MRIGTSFIATICLLASTTAVPQGTKQAPTFQSRTDLVLVPVIVQDSRGNHVSRLTSSDFKLQQDEKEQHIASVEEIRPSTTATVPVNQPAGQFSNRSAIPDQPQVIIVAIDLVNTPVLDAETARKAVLKFLTTQLKPNQAVGLVTIDRARVNLLHAFTTSGDVLSAALQSVTGSTMYQPIPEHLMVTATAERIAAFVKVKEEMEKANREMNNRHQQFDIGSALLGLCQIAHWVGGMPGRKVLIWVTGDIPYNVHMSPDGKPSKSLGAGYFEDYQFTYHTLAANNVALYPVDVRGLLTDWNDVTYLGPGSDVFNSALRGEVIGRPSTPSGFDFRHLQTSHAAMNVMADATGGRAFYNRNDIPKLFESAAKDSAHYYMLSYYLNRKQTQPGWHKLKVTVVKKGVTTRSRTGFFIPEQGQEQAEKNLDEGLALASPFEYTDLPITFRWRGTLTTTPKVEFELTVPPTAGLVDAEHNVVDLDFLAVTNGNANESAAKSMRNFHKQLSSEDVQQIAANGLTYIGDLQLKDGDYAIRVVVRDNLSGRMGSVTVPLKVER